MLKVYKKSNISRHTQLLKILLGPILAFGIILIIIISQDCKRCPSWAQAKKGRGSEEWI